MIKFRHSGDCGDIISSLLYIKTNCEQPGVLYLDYTHEDEIPYKHNLKFDMYQYEQISPIIAKQPYIDKVHVYTGQQYDIDCNAFRDYIFDNNCSLTDMYFMGSRKTPDYTSPWLHNINKLEMNENYNLIHRNFRYRSDNFDWRCVIDNEGLYDSSWFVGSYDEYVDFLKVTRLDKSNLPYLHTKTMEDLCEAVNGCCKFYGNGGLPLCIAHSLVKPVFVEIPFMPPGHNFASEPAKHNIIIRDNTNYYNHYDSDNAVDLNLLYKYKILS